MDMEIPTVRFPRRRGRRNQGLVEQLHVNLPPDLKDWVMSQPEEAAPFVRRLLKEEYERQMQQLATSHS